jgi:hypothetical protein
MSVFLGAFISMSLNFLGIIIHPPGNFEIELGRFISRSLCHEGNNLGKRPKDTPDPVEFRFKVHPYTYTHPHFYLQTNSSLSVE